MKFSIAAVMLACLQLALAPVCFCGSNHSERGTDRPSCCQGGDTRSPAPGDHRCPHCNERDTLVLSLPVNGSIFIESVACDLVSLPAPNWIFALPDEMLLGEAIPVQAEHPPAFRHLNRAILGVFVV